MKMRMTEEEFRATDYQVVEAEDGEIIRLAATAGFLVSLRMDGDIPSLRTMSDDGSGIELVVVDEGGDSLSGDVVETVLWEEIERHDVAILSLTGDPETLPDPS